MDQNDISKNELLVDMNQWLGGRTKLKTPLFRGGHAGLHLPEYRFPCCSVLLFTGSSIMQVKTDGDYPAAVVDGLLISG
jgi:hypothetical protein